MGDTVYVDLLFLINFSMDFLCFYIVARLTSRPLYLWRTAAASALGAGWGVIALLAGNGVFVLLGNVLTLPLICYVGAPRRDGLLRVAWYTLLYGTVSACVGGIMTAMYSLIGRISPPSDAMSPDAGEEGVSLWMLALLAAVAGAASLVGGRRLRRVSSSTDAEVKLTLDGKSAIVRGMTDTGNLLCDPLGGRQVIVCELDAVRQLLPPELVAYFGRGDPADVSSVPPALAASLRFVPAAGVTGRGHTMLAAFIPEKTEISDGRRHAEVDVLIAPVPRRIRNGEIRALMPPGLL